MEFKQLEAFVRVADYLSFSKAAEQMYLTQPTVSQHISELEKEMNCKLFARTTRTLSLTDFGKKMYPYAVRVLELRDTMIDHSTLSGHSELIIGASSIPAAYLLPDIAGRFHEAYPSVRFRIVQGNSTEIEKLVLSGVADIGLVGSECAARDLICEKLCDDELVLVTPATEYYHRMLLAEDIGALLREPFILREDGSGTQFAADRLFDGYRASVGETDADESHGINVVARCNDQESIKRMVISGMGLSIMSHLAAAAPEQEGRIYCLPLNEETQRSFYLISRKTMINNVHVRRFAAVARESGVTADRAALCDQ